MGILWYQIQGARSIYIYTVSGIAILLLALCDKQTGVN